MSEKIEVVNIHEIMSILPHRYPTLLVDKVIDIQDMSGVGVKNVTMNEPFFQGHFPGEPVMPGILLVEAMLQTACIVAKKLGIDISDDVFLRGVNQVRFRQPVVPGDCVHFSVKFLQKGDNGWECQASAMVDSAIAADAILFL